MIVLENPEKVNKKSKCLNALLKNDNKSDFVYIYSNAQIYRCEK